MSEEPLHLYYPLSLPRDIDIKLLLRVDSHMPDILDRLRALCGTGKNLSEATDELAAADFLHVNNPDLYRYKVRELLLAVFVGINQFRSVALYGQDGTTVHFSPYQQKELGEALLEPASVRPTVLTT